MPKVLHLRTVTGHGGGPEKTLLNSQRFIGGEYELRLAYIRPANDPAYDMPGRAAEAGVSLVDLPERGPVDPRTLWRLFRELRQFRPDLLHPHDYKTNILAVPLARLFDIPAVSTMHGYVTVGGRLNWYYRLDRWALRRMRHVVAVSEDLGRVLENLGIPAGRYTVVDNGIDCEQFCRTADATTAKLRLGIAPDCQVLGAIGRLAPEKGFDLLIDAAARLLARGYNIQLLIAGDGPEKLRLQQLAQQSGFSERMRFLGYEPDTIPLYEAMDIFVLSSRREGLPNSLLEACSMSLPVVAADVAGVPRVIRNGENGFLIKSPTPDEFAAAAALLLDDPNLRSRFGAKARLVVEERFSFRNRMSKIRAIYDAVLNHDRSPHEGKSDHKSWQATP